MVVVVVVVVVGNEVGGAEDTEVGGDCSCTPGSGLVELVGPPGPCGLTGLTEEPGIAVIEVDGAAG